MRWWMVLVSPSRMGWWLAYANLCLAVLVLLPGSQQHLFSWAPMVTFGALLFWGVTGMPLILIYNQHLLKSPRQMILLPLQIWLVFVSALQPPLAEAILLLPICTTAAMILLTANQDSQNLQSPGLPPPVLAQR